MLNQWTLIDSIFLFLRGSGTRHILPLLECSIFSFLHFIHSQRWVGKCTYAAKIPETIFPFLKIYFNRHLKVIRCGSGVFSVCLAILLYDGSIQHNTTQDTLKRKSIVANTKQTGAMSAYCKRSLQIKTGWNSFLSMTEKTHTVKVEDIDFAAYRLLNFQPPKISFRYW